MWEARLEPTLFSYNAGISACEKGRLWQQALALLSEAREKTVELDVSYSAGISACEKGQQWKRAMVLFGEMREAELEPTVILYIAGTCACEKEVQRGRPRARPGGFGRLQRVSWRLQRTPRWPLRRSQGLQDGP
ncbi:unnamed protein product [Prorocentrum cordatum]|uniref:Uncharacterized protein n=1 Tax=Prorocentrum cordatum TaxID=2364126 RepID=A0ABN9VLB1_9DINO|nr:unnamed protein product [Polarella glacialis]